MFAEQTPLVHTVPQAPQFDGSEATLTHALLQGVRPAPHVAEHMEAEQNGALTSQALPHMPQLPGLLVRSTQVPLHDV
jgi:hypothetical protein